MNSNPVVLWLLQAPGYSGQAGHVGELAFARTRADANSPKGIRITLKPSLSQSFLAANPQLHWVGVRVEVTSLRLDQRVYGRVLLDLHERSHSLGLPNFDHPNREIEWNWCLLPEDLERIERDSSENAKSPLNVRVTVEGTLQVGEQVCLVRGEGSLEIALSDWEAYLKVLGYNLPPSTAELAGRAVVDHPSWEDAARRLAPARNELRAGDGRDALVTSLRQFERVVTAPYSRDSWKGLFDVPGQKEDGMISMLAGHCTYLNKVGHHRSRQDRDPEGELIEMPVDQWEAELAVGTSQFLLAYALRAKRRAVETPATTRGNQT
jgi:hypothetical protein